MAKDNRIFADLKTINTLIKRIYPKAREINFNESGYDNIVVSVDKRYALRFPRDEDAYLRDEYEGIVLDGLKNLKALQVSALLETNKGLSYFVTEFLEGRTLSSQEINRLSELLQVDFANKLAEFVFELESVLSPNYIIGARKRLQLDMHEESYEIYFDKYVKQKRFPTREQDKIAKKYYNWWLSLPKDKKLVVVHDDLHMGNMLFVDNKISSILDFANTNVGMPEQEFRQLYRINDVVLNAAVEKYNTLSGYTLDIESIKIWAIMQELSMFSRRLFAKQTDHPSFLRASRNLNCWLGGGWGKGLLSDDAKHAKQ